MQEAADIRTVAVTPSVTIGYTLLNRHLIGEIPAIVSPGGFLSDVTSPDRAYEGTQLASLQRPVLLVDMPGHGLSTPNSPRQIFDFEIRRDSSSQAAPMLEAIQRVLGTTDQIDYFGNSHGGHLALKMTELDPEDRVGTVFGIDIPAVKKRSTVGLQIGYAIVDGILRRKEYLSALAGTEAEADYKKFKEAYSQMAPTRADSFLKKNPGMFLINLVFSGNASPLALRAWANIMDHKSAHVSIVTSENGHVSSPQAIGDFIAQLPEGQKVRSRQTIALGENHNLAMVHLMPRAVQWAKAAYDETTQTQARVKGRMAN